MTAQHRSSCYLIGSDTLLAQCGEILLEHGYAIRGVITGGSRIVEWARNHGIEVIPVESDYASRLQSVEFDYLFAITHLALIPDTAARAARKLAINFHDGPLPRYAGLNTPMWALLAGEEQYGITWHVMTAGIDEGDILLQQPVTIADDDTGLSLNTKCFAAALESFPRLIEQLSAGTLRPVPQQRGERSYFSRLKKPAAACVLDWQRPALELERLVRATNVGAYANPLGSAKLCLRDRAYIVNAASAHPDVARAQPGRVLRLDAEALEVQTAAGSLVISRLARLDGKALTLTEAAAECGIVAGDELASGNRERLTALNKRFARRETDWTRGLKGVDAIDMPQRGSGDGHSTTARRTFEVSIPKVFEAAGGDLDPIAKAAGAFVIFLARSLGTTRLSIAIGSPEFGERAEGEKTLYATHGFLTVDIDAGRKAWDELGNAVAAAAAVFERGPWLRDLVAREPVLKANPCLAAAAAIPVAVVFGDRCGSREIDQAEIVVRVTSAGTIAIEFDPALYAAAAIGGLARQFERVLETLGANADVRFSDLDLVDDYERRRLLEEWNDTATDYDREAMIHTAFEQQASKTPNAIAVCANGREITFAELNDRAEQIAQKLQAMGIGPDTLVGVHVGRSIELMVATLGILKAGGAYVPLDPAFPADRIEFMIADSAMPVIISQAALKDSLPPCAAEILDIDSAIESAIPSAAKPLEHVVRPTNLAYVIYTSGSTGRPKGVMIEHRNAINFFVGMDQRVPRSTEERNTWLAVTSLSFDISVLELFWTLTRGFKVVIHDEARTKTGGASGGIKRPLGLGLFMWGNDDAPGPAKYRLLMEGSKFFDEHGFAAVWTPERHFHAFGGPYPNPAVTGAAVAAVTKHIKIRSGSCVVPLHHPIRIAEEWAVVDNLSDGRVELAAASGWNPNDFVLRPENHKNNKQVMFDSIEQVRALWRGETLSFPGPLGADVAVQSLPRPVQDDLTFWVTTAGNPETWKDAGTRGFNVLTHLLGQTVEEVGEKIRIYREARAAAGFDPEAGKVALMLHTFVGEDDDSVRELVREPMKSYLASSMRLAMNFAWSFPAFKRPGGSDSKPEDIDIKSLSAEDVDTILNFAFERYFETSGLFGDVETCFDMLESCSVIGVDEIACLLDFGVATDAIMESLPRLKLLRDRIEASLTEIHAEPAADLSFAGLAASHNVTHLQCTPSMARLYSAEATARAALADIPHLLLGGEALPSQLAQELLELRSGTLTNMYGPTETTIWSMTQPIASLDGGISIGTAIANTQVYVLDKFRRPVPTGMPGELYIGGDGVARGYLNRPELTADRFVRNPFSDRPDARMYATGDLASFRPDGTMDFIGRADFQVKVRGYRIELGEIESVIEAQPGILEAAVIVKADDAADQRLVAFMVPRDGVAAQAAELRSALRAKLPEYMIPNEFVTLLEMPRTANGKLDRKALQAIRPEPVRQVTADALPQSETEKLIVDSWRKTLKLEHVGVNDNFFDLGGHSLLVVQLHNELKQRFSSPLSLTDLYQYPTVRSLSEYIASGSGGEALQKSASRGARRRALRKRSA